MTDDYSDILKNDIIKYLVSIKEKEGIKGLFVGIYPRLLRAIASGAIQFATYEISQNFLNNN